MGMLNCIKGKTQVYPGDPLRPEREEELIPRRYSNLETRMRERNSENMHFVYIISLVHEDAKLWELDDWIYEYGG